MTAASNVQIRDYRDGNLYNDWFDRSTNKVVTAGYGYGGYNWVVVVKFDLDKASGGLSLTLTAGDVRGSYRELNYKIVQAAEYDEDSPYNNATYDMAADGKLTMSRYNYTPITANISGIRPAGTYYLYLWTARAANPNATCYSAITNNANGRITVEYDAVAGTASTLALTGGTMGQPVSIAIARDNSGFVHTLRWIFAGSSGAIVTETTDVNLTWTPGAEQFGALIPTASSGLLTIECTTLYEGELIGTTTSTMTLSVPADSAPVLSEGWAMLSHTNDGTAASSIGACVVGFSKAVVTFDVSKVSARYGARMQSLTARLGGLTSEGGVLGTITSTETAVVVTATDSRGKSSSETLTIAAHPYSIPVLSGVSVYRADINGDESEAGAFYAVTAAVSFSAAGGAIDCALTAAIKPAGGSYGAEDALVSGEMAVLGGALSDTTTYIVRVSALDTLGGAASIEVTIPTAAAAFHIREGGDGIGLGKYGEAEGAVDSAFDLAMNGHSIIDAAYVPPILTATAEGETDELLREAYAEMAVGTIKTIRMEQKVVDGLPKRGTWFMTLFCADGNYGVISAVSDWVNGALEFKRLIYNGTWGDWTRVLTAEAVLDAVYPVGSIYIAFDHTSPAARFGGTWTRIQGAFLWGAAEDAEIGSGGGSQTHSHSLGAGFAQINHHDGKFWFTEMEGVSYTATGSGTSTGANVSSAQTAAIALGGSTDSGDSMPPYITVSIWRRTA